MLPVPTARMPVGKNAVYYKMDHKQRGKAIIFNHEKFDRDFKPRLGTYIDCLNLENTFKGLGFHLQVYNDLTKSRVIDIIQQVANEDHQDRDCLVVAVLSHGHHGIVYTKDSFIQLENLWTPFTADKCPSLAGKPKIFFIQACQGGKVDDGLQMLHTDSDSSCLSYKIPVHSDFLIAHATISGFVAWRNKSEGSCFIWTLCKVLQEHGFYLDLLTILTLVNQHVAIDFETNNPECPSLHQKKQIPCIVFMLTRLLKFTSKPRNVDPLQSEG